MNQKFTYIEDDLYFENLFSSLGGISSNMKLFDFRPLEVKRKEFNKIRNNIHDELTRKHGLICQLRCHPDCSDSPDQIDHLIPLSSNSLNKKLRKIKGTNGKKTPQQSFGSNHTENFVLACKRCNAFKKNNLPSIELIQKIYENR